MWLNSSLNDESGNYSCASYTNPASSRWPNLRWWLFRQTRVSPGPLLISLGWTYLWFVNILIVKIEAAFSASPRNTNPHNYGIKHLLLYCFNTQRIVIPLTYMASTVLITFAMAHIFSGIHRNFKNDTLWYISILLNPSAKQIGKSIKVSLLEISLNGVSFAESRK